MKNKKATYILLPVALAIWGLIGWKLWGNAQAPDDNWMPPIATSAPKTVDSTAHELPPLIADYRDPFLGRTRNGSQLVQQQPQPVKPTPKAEEPPPPPTPWPTVNYHGMIKNMASGKKLGLLMINDKKVLASENQLIAELLVVTVAPDSVVLVWGEEKKTVEKVHEKLAKK